jgi:RNA polymerase sigma-70 factor (ECF subfamily)
MASLSATSASGPILQLLYSDREVAYLQGTTEMEQNEEPRDGGANGGRESDDKDIAFSDQLLKFMPTLRALSHTLCRDVNLSEDIFQETLCKAWAARASFQPGTNISAWLCKIFKNSYYNVCRRAWRNVRLNDTMVSNIEAPHDEQLWALELADAVEALRVLSSSQRKLLLLVALGGLSYDDAAAKCDCALGTAKSRVTRSRQYVQAALTGSGRRFRRKGIPVNQAVNQVMLELQGYLVQE